ncbi:MAG: hypothetical protein AB9869_34920 [Verrucomicrobiia bacterium]
MNTTTLTVSVFLAGLISWSQQTRADFVGIGFSATIERSPFITPGYAVGDLITGWFGYDSNARPSSSGAGPGWEWWDTTYPAYAAHWQLGEAEYASRTGHINLYHNAQERLGGVIMPVDTYRFIPDRPATLSGPAVEGMVLSDFRLILYDLDHTYYNRPQPLPIDFPPVEFFESKALYLDFGSESSKKTIQARIDSFPAPYYDAPDSGASLWLLSASLGLLALGRSKSMIRQLRRHVSQE